MEIYSFGGDIHENCNFLIGFVFVSAQHEDSTGFSGMSVRVCWTSS